MSDLLACSRVAGFVLELRTDTTHTTAYLEGRPFATVRRARYGSDEPRWQAFGLDGKRIAHASGAGTMVRMVETQALCGPQPEPACVVTLAPDYEARPLRLAMYRARRGWTLCGQERGHRFERLTYLGVAPPVFRTRADLAEWCALVGLAVAVPDGRKRGEERFTEGQLSAASVVATVGGAA